MKKKINFLTIISLLIAIIPFGVYVYCYPQFPEQVAMHYNGNGIADRFVNKSSYEILILCGLGLFSIFFIKHMNWL